MIQSYKQKYQVADHYDAVIIGSGMGSLSTAAILAKEGKRVLVLERHYTAGGFTHVFKRRGYEWDVGIHYIGEMQRERSLTKKLFDYVSDGELTWADMGEVYDRIVIGENTYDLVKGVTQLKAKLISYFPDEEEAILAYFDLVFQSNKTIKKYFMEKAMPPLVSKVAGRFMRSDFLAFASRTTLEVLEELTDNQELIKVLTAQYGDYGMPPSKSSFSMHAALVSHYFSGGNFPIGGSSRIAETIDAVIEKSGGTILINAEVDEVVIEGNRAVGVRMADGKVFTGKTIISGAGIINTYRKMMPEKTVKKHRLLDQLEQVTPSVAHVCLYIGLNGTPDELKLPKANYWVYPDDLSHDANIERYVNDISQPFPVVYVSFPAAKDPDWSNRYPGKSTIDIITLMPYDAFAQWENTPWKKRGADYEAFKEQIAQRLLNHLFELEPQVRDHIDYYELSTPLTTRHFVNYDQGEIYGLEHDPARFSLPFLRPHTPIKNFFLTGQDVATVGVGGALLSGLLTAAAITKKNLVNKVMAEPT